MSDTPKDPRADLRKTFSKGMMPSEGNFAHLIETMALDQDLKRTDQRSLENEETLEELATLQKGDTQSVQLERALGLEGRYGTWAADRIFHDYEEHYQPQDDKKKTATKFEEVIFEAKTAPFAAEVIAYIEDPREHQWPKSWRSDTTMMHALVLRPKDKAPTIRTAYSSFSGFLGERLWSSSFTRLILVILTAAVLLFAPGLFDSLTPLQEWLCGAAYETGAECPDGIGKSIVDMFEQANSPYRNMVGVFLLIVGVGMALNNYITTPAVHLKWSRDEGLLLITKQLHPKCKVRWHVTRLW